jgi:hypothetical protein
MKEDHEKDLEDVLTLLEMLKRILPLCWLPRHLHGQPLKAGMNPHAWGVCHGCRSGRFLDKKLGTLVEGMPSLMWYRPSGWRGDRIL